MLIGTFTRYQVAAVLATVGIILAAIYILWMYQRTMTGPVREDVAGMPDLRARELWAVVPADRAAHRARRLSRSRSLDMINPAVQQTLAQAHPPIRSRRTRRRRPCARTKGARRDRVRSGARAGDPAPHIEYGPALARC